MASSYTLKSYMISPYYRRRKQGPSIFGNPHIYSRPSCQKSWSLIRIATHWPEVFGCILVHPHEQIHPSSLERYVGAESFRTPFAEDNAS